MMESEGVRREGGRTGMALSHADGNRCTHVKR